MRSRPRFAYRRQRHRRDRYRRRPATSARLATADADLHSLSDGHLVADATRSQTQKARSPRTIAFALPPPRRGRSSWRRRCRADLPCPARWPAIAFAQIRACAAWARRDCFCPRAGAGRAIAVATLRSRNHLGRRTPACGAQRKTWIWREADVKYPRDFPPQGWPRACCGCAKAADAGGASSTDVMLRWCLSTRILQGVPALP
jgi:hypothetical protein